MTSQHSLMSGVLGQQTDKRKRTACPCQCTQACTNYGAHCSADTRENHCGADTRENNSPYHTTSPTGCGCIWMRSPFYGCHVCNMLPSHRCPLPETDGVKYKTALRQHNTNPGRTTPTIHHSNSSGCLVTRTPSYHAAIKPCNQHHAWHCLSGWPRMRITGDDRQHPRSQPLSPQTPPALQPQARPAATPQHPRCSKRFRRCRNQGLIPGPVHPGWVQGAPRVGVSGGGMLRRVCR